MTKVKTKNQEDRVLRYLKALKELKLILDNTSKLSIHGFTKSHNLSVHFCDILKKGGVIKANRKGNSPEWEWISIEPNRHMALKVIDEITNRNVEYYNMKKEKNIVASKPKKENNLFSDDAIKEKDMEVSYYEVKMLFGLLKLKAKPVFKIK